MQLRNAISGFVLFACAAVGQEFSGPPSFGVIYDAPTQSLRRIAGVPGAAYLAESLVTGITFACVAPGSKSALVLEQGHLTLVNLVTGTRSVVIETAASIARCVWDVDGSAVAVRGEVSGWVRLVEPLTWNATPAGQEIIAITDGGKTRAYTSERATYINRDDSGLMPVLPEMAQSGHFAPDGRLYVASKSGEVFVYQDGAASPLARLGAAIALHLVRPGRLGAITERGLTLFYMESSDERVVADTPAASLERLTGTTYLLRSRTNESEPVWVYDASQDLTMFVPGGKQ